MGHGRAPLEGRKRALDEAAAKLSEDDLYPYDRATATGNGLALSSACTGRRSTSPWRAARRQRRAAPTILLAGDRDLSTPMECGRSRPLRRAPAAAS